MNNIKIMQENGRVADHSLEGVIFNRVVKDGIIHYINALECTYNKMEIVTDLSYYCNGQEDLISPNFLYLLVRHGRPDNYNYYPMYLLFADESKRKQMAAYHNKLPPKNNWIERKREDVKRVLACAFNQSL